MIDQPRHGFVFGWPDIPVRKTSLAEKIISHSLPVAITSPASSMRTITLTPTPPARTAGVTARPRQLMLISSALRRVKFTETPDKTKPGCPHSSKSSPRRFCSGGRFQKDRLPQDRNLATGNRAPFLYPELPGIRMVASDTRLPTAPARA